MTKENGSPYSLDVDYTGRVAKSNFYFKVAAGGFGLTAILYRSEQYAAATVVGGISLLITLKGLEVRYANKSS